MLMPELFSMHVHKTNDQEGGEEATFDIGTLPQAFFVETMLFNNKQIECAGSIQ